MVAALPVLGQVALPPPAGEVLFRVHPETTFQTMVGFGAGFNAGSLQNFNAIQKPADRDRAYDLLYGPEGVRLNIVRLTISPHAQPVKPPGSGDLKAGGTQYDWAGDDNTQAAWQSIQPVLKRTKPILYAVPFTPPPRWKDTGRPTKGGTLQPAHYRDYAEYLASFLEYYHKDLGVDIDVLSLQNEPGVAAPWESCLWTGAALRDFLKILAPQVRARGLATRFMLSEGTAWSGARDHLAPTLADPEAHRLLNIMASHSYGAPEDKARSQFAAVSAKTGLPVWMSEMSLMFPPAPDDPGMPAALQTARFLHRDLVEAHVCAWIYCFAIFTSKFPGSMGVLAPADGAGPLRGTLQIPKRCWALAHYSHFVRPGWKLMQIEGGGPDQTGFVDPQCATFVIVALNPGAQPQAVTYDFGARNMGAVEAFATTAELDLARIPSPVRLPHRIHATLLPLSVTTFAGSWAP
jgi:O-glycosyl hydrolase